MDLDKAKPHTTIWSAIDLESLMKGRQKLELLGTMLVSGIELWCDAFGPKTLSLMFGFLQT